MLSFSGATAVRFHTEALSSQEADAFHEALGGIVPAHDVWLGGADGTGWVGAIAPIDTSERALLLLIDRLRATPLILPLTVAVGRFP
jgi:hypothetical protein